MRRRSFLKAGGIALGTGLAANSLLAKIPPHNFDKYDFGGGPPVRAAGKVRQAKLALPKGTKRQGLRLKAKIEVKGQRYPVRWACRQKSNEERKFGSLTLRQPVGLGAEDETGGVPRGPE